MGKRERETEGERVGVGLGTQRNLADCSTSESLNRFVTERKGERVGEMRGGIWETISPTLSGRFPHHKCALHTLKNNTSSTVLHGTGSAENSLEGSWVG